jgi:hypothetical protein
MKWQYEPVEPNQPPVVLLLHYRTREELMQIVAPTVGQVSHAHAMMRAAAAASALSPSMVERGGVSESGMPPRGGAKRRQIARTAACLHRVIICAGAMARGGLSDDFNGDRRAGHPRLSLDDDDLKVGLRRTFSNSSCGSFSSDAVFKSELLSGEDQFMSKDLPFERRRNHITDIDDVSSASHLIESKPSPLLLPQHSPTLHAMRSPPLLTSPGAPLLFTQ